MRILLPLDTVLTFFTYFHSNLKKEVNPQSNSGGNFSVYEHVSIDDDKLMTVAQFLNADTLPRFYILFFQDGR